ncbi:hypothetical protein [Paraburkholderia sp. RL17-337-BIB-A]|uniref:hypothetical protein n=1 Tax=Paraburkholderia sp. RL17-337-BIB-A TaxID=3031636 RepID=UPI0038B84AA8
MGDHLGKIPQTELVAQEPAGTRNDEFAIKVSPIEQLVKTIQLISDYFSLLIANYWFVQPHALADSLSILRSAGASIFRMANVCFFDCE